jgi:hypothetical protein
MEVVIVDNHLMIPKSFTYKVYQGDQALCLNCFKKNFPNYDPGLAYYHQGLSQLWVPMEFQREWETNAPGRA